MALAFGLHRPGDPDAAVVPGTHEVDLVRARMLHAQDPENYPEPVAAAMDASAVLEALGNEGGA